VLPGLAIGQQRLGVGEVLFDPLAETASAPLFQEPREVGLGAQILRALGVTSIRLRSDSPRKYVGLAGFGVEIAKVEPIEG